MDCGSLEVMLNEPILIELKHSRNEPLELCCLLGDDDEIDINRIHFDLKLLKLDDQLQLQILKANFK